jgi:hypothetical protein
MSPALQAKLDELRAFAADPFSIAYVFATKTGKRILVYPEEIDAHPTDEGLLAHLGERIKAKDEGRSE